MKLINIIEAQYAQERSKEEAPPLPKVARNGDLVWQLRTYFDRTNVSRMTKVNPKRTKSEEPIKTELVNQLKQSKSPLSDDEYIKHLEIQDGGDVYVPDWVWREFELGNSDLAYRDNDGTKKKQKERIQNHADGISKQLAHQMNLEPWHIGTGAIDSTWKLKKGIRFFAGGSYVDKVTIRQLKSGKIKMVRLFGPETGDIGRKYSIDDTIQDWPANNFKQQWKFYRVIP